MKKRYNIVLNMYMAQPHIIKTRLKKSKAEKYIKKDLKENGTSPYEWLTIEKS